MPKVSVIIPTYNRVDLLPETLKSVFLQTFTDYEIIVVDDGSSDDTRAALNPLIESGKIRYHYQSHRGLSSARNTGIQNSNGKYIAFLDSDDLFTPLKLEKQVAFLDNNPDGMLLHSDYSKFASDGTFLGTRDTSFFSGWVYPHILLHWSSLMAVACVMMPSRAFKEIGLFDESLTAAEDLDMWARVAQLHPFSYLPEPLAKVRVHAASMSADKSRTNLSFRRYLQLAFDRDPELTPLLKRRVLSNMYVNVAQNVVGDGPPRYMPIVRRNCALAVKSWPFQLPAYLTFSASILGVGMRAWLLKLWRARKYDLTNS